MYKNRLSFAVSLLLTGSLNAAEITSSSRALTAGQTGTVSAGTTLNGGTTDDYVTVTGSSVTVEIDGKLYAGEDVIKAIGATSGLSITIGSSGEIIATENSSGNAYDAIDLNGDGSGDDYSGTNGLVATNATITNNGTIWVADKGAVDAGDSTGLTITNTGTMSARDDAIKGLDASSLTITNSGRIAVDSESSNSATYGASVSEDRNSTTDNTAAIAFHGNDNTTTAVSGTYYSDGLTLTNQSGGTITADYETISLYESSTQKSKNITITNHGTISATQNASGDPNNESAIYGEYVENFTLTNTGTISAKDDTINLDNASGTISITNSGTISSDDTFAVSVANMTASGSSFTLNNTGTISSSGGLAVYVDSSNKAITITNSGTIDAGTGNYAIDGDGTTNLTITNTGTLSAGNKTVMLASGGTLTNSGTIKATTVSNPAIYIDNANNTVTLENGSVIIGDIEFKSTASSNTLKMDVGSARSYVYSVTDNSTTWTLTDLDGRDAVKGSAKAAGIANVETADETLFNRNNAINQSLARYTRTANNGTWADIYGSTTQRDADGNTVNKYQQNLVGVTLVKPQDNNTQMVVALQRANADLDSGVQDVDSTSITVGLQKANVFNGATARAMLTYNDYDSSQEVLDNTSSTGFTTYTGDYDSLGLTLGLNKSHTHQTANGDVTVTFDGELAHERIDDYSETATFAWKARNLTQLSASASGLWQKNVNGKDVFVNAGLTARGLVSGKKANYTIDSNSASFDGGNQSEVLATLGAGVDYNTGTDSVARFEVQSSYSNRKSASVGLATTFDWKF